MESVKDLTQKIKDTMVVGSEEGACANQEMPRNVGYVDSEEVEDSNGAIVRLFAVVVSIRVC